MPGKQSLKLYESSPELGPLQETHFLSHKAPWVWEDSVEPAPSRAQSLPRHFLTHVAVLQHSRNARNLCAALEASYVGMLLAPVNLLLLVPWIP